MNHALGRNNAFSALAHHRKWNGQKSKKRLWKKDHKQKTNGRSTGTIHAILGIPGKVLPKLINAISLDYTILGRWFIQCGGNSAAWAISLANSHLNLIIFNLLSLYKLFVVKYTLEQPPLIPISHELIFENRWIRNLKKHVKVVAWSGKIILENLGRFASKTFRTDHQLTCFDTY